jgi:hypothetical protein
MGDEGLGRGIEGGAAAPAGPETANGYCAFIAASTLTEPGMMLVSASSSIGKFAKSAGTREGAGMGGGFGAGTHAPGDEPGAGIPGDELGASIPGDEPVRGGGIGNGSEPDIGGGGTEPLAFFSRAVAVI